MSALLMRLQGVVFTLLLVLALVLAGWLLQRHNVVWHWGGSIAHELSLPSQRLLGQMAGEVEAIAFVPEGNVLRGHVRELFGRYAAIKPDFRFDLVNPDTRPDLVRQLGIERAGEVVIRYGGRSERVQVPTETHVSAALERLQREQGQFIGFLTGHGEGSLLREANHDLGAFGMALREKGYRLQGISLARLQAVPQNTALLVVAAPQTELLPAELERLQAYVERGGNLLWLAEPAAATQLPAVAARLGVRWLPGVILDPLAMASLGTQDPRMVLVNEYPAHAATAKLQAPTLFPQAKALSLEGEAWQHWPLLVAADGQFLADYQPGQALRAPERTPPLVLGAALSRRLEQARQRVVVMGDADFLTNSYIGNGANRQLGLNLVDWLTESEAFLDSYARAAPDQVLDLRAWAVMAIGFGFLLGVPGLGLGIAAWQWWRRRNG